MQITASPAAGYSFAGFSGVLSGTANPQILTMSGPTTVTATYAVVCTFSLSSTSAGVSGAAGTGTVGLNRIQSRLRVHGFQQRGMAHYHGIR